MKYPLTSDTWNDDERSAIQNVINKGRYSMNKKVLEFETDFARHFGSKYAVMVNSGSSTNLLMVATLFFMKESSLKAGDKVRFNGQQHMLLCNNMVCMLNL